MRAFEVRADSPRPGAPPYVLLPPLRPPPPEPREDTRHPGVRRRWPRRAGIGVVAFAALAAGVALWAPHRAAPPNYVTAPVDRGNVVKLATASGMVNPVETVKVGS